MELDGHGGRPRVLRFS